MKKKQTWSLAERLLIAWVGLMMVIVFISIIPGWERTINWWDGQDLPAWVQAIGSVAAIYSAIWLVTREDQRRKNQERDVAELHALKIRRQLEMLHSFAKRYDVLLTFISDNKPGAEVVAEYLEKLVFEYSLLAIPSHDDVLALVAAPDRVATKIAHSIAGLELAVAMCKTLEGRKLGDIQMQIAVLEVRSALILIPERLLEASTSLFKFTVEGKELKDWML